MAVACICCRRDLKDLGTGSPNHASDANAFISYGQYGSRLFDPMDGSYLEVNICDQCLEMAVTDCLVLRGKPREFNKLEIWDPRKEDFNGTEA